MASSRITSVVIAMFLVGLMPSDASANKWFAWLEELSGPGPFKGNTLRFDVYCNGRLEKRTLDAYVAQLQKPVATTELEKTEQAAENERARQKFLRSAWCRPDRANVRFSLGVEAGWWTARENPAFAGDVDLRTLYVILYSPVGTIFRPGSRRGSPPPTGLDTSPLRAIEIGAGFGGYRMSGSAVQTSDYRVWVVPLRVRVFPSELLSPVNPGNRDVPQWRVALRAISLYGGIDYLPGRLPSSAFRMTGPTVDTLSEHERVPTWGINIDVLAFLPGGALVR